MGNHSTFEPPIKGFWLFAYGSLMWNPDFPYAEKAPARLHGYHRALCIYSWVYRGTKQNPGLVFGLDRGGSVTGMAFRIKDKDATAVYERVYAREMPTAVYRPRWCKCNLKKKGPSKTVGALAFVAAPEHEQYAGRLTDDQILRLVRSAQGTGGTCREYVSNTLAHMEDIGTVDQRLLRLK